MKKILYIILLCAFNFVLKAQTTPYTGLTGYPINQSIGSDSAAVNSKGLLSGRVVLYRFTDTTAANLQRIKNYPFALIGTTNDNTLWMRNKYANKWERGSGSIDIDYFDFLTDSSLVICFGNGTCDTISLYHFTDVVNNIVQNFLDSSVYNINDSTIIICNAAGSCDTISLGNSYSYYFLNDSTLVTCDTTRIDCIGDSCYQTTLCDTINIPRVTAPIYQNLLWQNNNIIEAGDPLFGTQAQMLHNTYFNTNGYQLKVQGYPITSPVLSTKQYQWSSLSASIQEWNSYGAYQPNWGLPDENNPVYIRINYFNPFTIPTQGVFTGDTVGFMYNRYGYAIMTNALGGNHSFNVDDANAKQVGIFFDTYSDNNEGVSIFAQQVASTYSFGNQPPVDSTLLTKRVTVFKTNGQVQFNQYTTGAFPITSPLYIIAQDANGDLYQFPPGGFSGGGGTSGLILQANNGLSIYQDTIVQLFGPVTTPSTLLNDRYLSQGAFELFHSGNLASYMIDVQNSNGSGSGIYALGESTGVTGQTTNGIGVQGQATGGFGIFGSSSDAGIGVYGRATNGTNVGVGGVFEATDNTTNNIIPIVQIKRTNSSGTPAAGAGGSIEYYLRTSTGSSQISNTLASKWVVATHASRTSQLDVTGINSTSPTTIASFYGTGVVGIGISSSYTATRLNVVDNTISTTPMVKFTSTSTAASGSLQKLVEIILSGANANASEQTVALNVSNTHSGTGAINYGGSFAASNGAANYGVYGNGSTTGVYGEGNIGTLGIGNTYGAYGQSNAGVAGVYGQAQVGVGVQGQVDGSGTNDVMPLYYAIRSSTGGTGADGIGGSFDFQIETSAEGSLQQSNQIISKWTTANDATRTSKLDITGVTGASSQTWFSFLQSGAVKFRPMTVTEAGAIATAEGLMVFVSNTDATFTSIGLWIYQNGAWKAL